MYFYSFQHPSINQDLFALEKPIREHRYYGVFVGDGVTDGVGDALGVFINSKLIT